MKSYRTPEKLIASILKQQTDEVCRISYDLNQNPNAFVNECVAAVIRMMNEVPPTLPPIVVQYKALKSAHALKSQLETKTAAVSPAVTVSGKKK